MPRVLGSRRNRHESETDNRSSSKSSAALPTRGRLSHDPHGYWCARRHYASCDARFWPLSAPLDRMVSGGVKHCPMALPWALEEHTRRVLSILWSRGRKGQGLVLAGVGRLESVRHHSRCPRREDKKVCQQIWICLRPSWNFCCEKEGAERVPTLSWRDVPTRTASRNRKA